MTTIAVVGGTGQAGRAVARAARERGHQVRVLSRHVPDDARRVPGATHHRVDLLADDAAAVGAALDAALAGADAVVDTSNGQSPGAMKIFTVGARRVAAAAGRAGVGHVVVLSIAGVDRSTYAYYRAHVEQERTYAAGEVPATIVRATQFHGFLGMFLGPDGRLGAWSRLGLLPVPRGTRFQPIALADVARAIVDAAERPGPAAGSETVTIGGPEVLDARDMARAWRRAHGSRRVVVAVPLPGSIGEFFRAGGNLAPEHRYGTVTYADWLAASARPRPASG